MFLTIHQPEFMPWAAYFEKLLRTDHFVALDSVKFQKNYFINRCRIKQNDEPGWLTVPVRKGPSDEAIAQTRVGDNQAVWGKKCFHALYYNYRRAPFWGEHEAFFDDTFNVRQWDRLADLNLAGLAYFAAYLDIPFNLTRSSEMTLECKGSDLVLEICQNLGATRYLSGAFGRDYLDEAAFAAAGIEVVYQDYEAIPYEQFNGPYCGPLSIIDMVLNLGRDARRLIEQGRRA